MPDIKLSGPSFTALNEAERRFVEMVVDQGLAPARAKIESGIPSKSSGTALVKKPHIEAAITERRHRYEHLFDVDRRKVVDGMMDAINMAKIMSEPMTMVAGWREVGRLCGYYEAPKQKVDINVTGSVTVPQIQEMSDDELLRLATTVEGTAERVS